MGDASQLRVSAGSRHGAISAVLGCRALVNGLFACWLFARGPTWDDVFAAASIYALADGALALVTTAVLASRPGRLGAPFLLSMTATNALILIAAGVALRVWPGISGFPVTLVMFYGAVGVWAASLGAVAIAMAVRVIVHDRGADRRHRLRDHELVDPIVIGGLVAILFVAYALIVGPPTDAPTLRHVAGLGTGLLAVVFLTASIGTLLRRD